MQGKRDCAVEHLGHNSNGEYHADNRGHDIRRIDGGNHA